MRLSETEKAKFDTLPKFMRFIVRQLIEWINRILNNECDEDEITDAINKIDKHSTGYKREDEYISVDEACKILGCSRATFYSKYVRKYKLVNEKFKTVPIGYKKSKIITIKNQENG